ncbi:hypothetical protein A8990_10334 [Paenibacillus taihuensis]|uniref:Sporulation lipoprotein YhcN/YlaJ n=1 Tax=Paenibacillus taihuensis TaxID=1156355 RepID=A0A3D9SCZ8_9BACL|nr:hypothetical protein [Paenibacillus taihuensis]REE92736.1 hypothetical protein A8990_10334 [Paenibacillus taihuensis]
MKSKLMIVSAAGALLLLGGCATAKTEVKQQSANAAHKLHEAAARDPYVIPSAHGVKTMTTNRQGSTTNGMGTTVYSMIGSSGLHSTGFSAHLESRLSGVGISDVRVFVFDDTVVLATDKRTPNASQYDDVQRKLLSPNEGISGKGSTPGHGLGGMSGTDTSSHDNLTLAADKIQEFMGGKVKVYTVESAKAVQTIEQIRADATADKLAPAKLAGEIQSLLQIVESQGH